MPTSKNELMKKLRQRRKDAGLIELRVWCTPTQVEWITEFLNESDPKKRSSKK